MLTLQLWSPMLSKRSETNGVRMEWLPCADLVDPFNAWKKMKTATNQRSHAMVVTNLESLDGKIYMRNCLSEMPRYMS